jgi:hypothetical protein
MSFASRHMAVHRPGGATPPPPPPVSGQAVYGIWAIRNLASTAEMSSASGEINNALVNFRTTGFSLRAPWSSMDAPNGTLNTSMLSAARNLVTQASASAGVEKSLSLRFMAGHWCPTRVTNDPACPWYTISGTTGRIPLPFHDDGSFNTAFEAYYEEEVDALAAWCRLNGVRLLHLPWYGQDWAEVNHGITIRNGTAASLSYGGTQVSGYTYQRFLDSHTRLMDIAYPYAGDDLAIEWPLTGFGPITGSTPFADDIMGYARVLTALDDSPLIYIQGNGWDENGMRGGAGEEAAFQTALNENQVRRGLQMIGVGGGYQWGSPTTGVFQYLYRFGAHYGEIYTNIQNGVGSFTGASGSSLATPIADFADFIGAGV